MEKNKIAITADTHFSNYSSSKINNECGMSDVLYGIRESFKYMVDYIYREGIRTLIIAGDINHNKSVIHTHAQSILVDILEKCLERYEDLKFILLDGNHDLTVKGSNAYSSLVSLSKFPNVETVHSPRMFMDCIYLLPYSYDLINKIKCDSKDCRYMISHFGLNEAMVDSGISIRADVKLSDLRVYDEVFLGHYHAPQNVGNVTYVGSLSHLDWNDKNQTKRFLIFDLDSGKKESIESRGHKRFYEFKLTSKNYEETIKESRKLQSEGHHVYLSKVDDIVISEEDDKDLIIIDKTEKETSDRGIKSSMSLKEKVFRYMKIMDIPNNEHNNYFNIFVKAIENEEYKC